MAAVKRKSSAASKTTLRHVWLAGLGLVAVSRRRVRALVGDAGARVRQVEPCVVQFSSDVEARLAPVLDKLGLKQQAKRQARKATKRAARA